MSEHRHIVISNTLKFLLLDWSAKICKKEVLNNNEIESLIRKRKKSAWYHSESVLQSSVLSDPRG